MQRSAYRPDIDGLRAVAVVAVVLFHLGFERLAGGFVGVDVFFVISGFLITRIIAGKAAAGRFSFRDFYLARIRRIIPPLIATVAATFLAAAFVLTPDDFQRFARSAVGALTSTSNIIFYLEAGYWDTASELKPLLHTWSLGVEEQFYLFWPAAVIGLLALSGQRRFALVLLGVAIATFAGTLVYTGLDPSGAFYLFPFRIFQFAAGAALGVATIAPGWQTRRPPGWVRDGLFGAGLVLVIVSVLVFDAQTVFPGWAALVPTLGAALMMLSGSFTGGQGRIGHLVLGNRVSVWAGRVSYALYLVHWPVVSLYRYRTGLDLVLVEQAALAVAMLAAAVLLHYGLERRFYRRLADDEGVRQLPPVRFALHTLAAGLLAGAFAGHAWWSGGWNWRIPDLSFTAEQIEAGKRNRFSYFSESCQIGDYYSDEPQCRRDNVQRVLFLGNSHEPDAFNFVRAGYGGRGDLEFIRFGTVNRCPELRLTDADIWASRGRCQLRLDVFNRADFLASLDYLVYSARFPFSGNKQTLYEMIAWVKARNPDIRVITMGGYLNTDIPCVRIVNETGSARGCASPEHIFRTGADDDDGGLYTAIMELTDVFIDRMALLCADERVETCLVETPEGIPFSYDEHHLSREFAEMSGRMYAARNPDLFGPPPAAAPGAATAPGGQD